MEYRLDDLAQRIGAVCTAQGGLLIRGVSLPGEATPEEIVFLDQTSLDQATGCRAGAFLVDTEFAERISGPLLLSPTPRLAFIRLLELFLPVASEADGGIHPTAVLGRDCQIHETARVLAGAVLGARVRLAEGVWIHPLCQIGDDVSIGAGSVVHPGVSIGWGCRVGARCTLYPGAVLGADGFGFHHEAGSHYRYPHLGIVELGDDVEVGANSTIDRAVLGKTRIGDRTKIDNLVQIAHNCRIGSDCYLVAQSGIAGSAVIEDGVMIAGQAGISDHVRIGSGAIVVGQAGVRENVPPWTVVGATPAVPIREAIKIWRIAPISGLTMPGQVPTNRKAECVERAEIRGKILELFAEICQVEPEEIRDDSDLREDLDADSLTALSILTEIEREFDIEVTDAAARNLKTLGSVVSHVETLLERKRKG